MATLYSPASLRVQWMLDRRSDGAAWADRDAEAETRDNTARTAMSFYSRLLRHLGVEQRFLSPALLADGALRQHRYRVLILPHAVALSADESDEIRRFVAHGGTVIADVLPGSFDQHGRRLRRAALADLFAGKQTSDRGHAVLYPRAPGEPGGSIDPETLRQFESLLAQANVRPALQVTTAAGETARNVEIYRYRFGETTILALQREFPSGTIDAAQAAETFTVVLPQSFFIEDLRQRRALGNSNRVTLALDPVQPTFLALTGDRGSDPQISAPAHGEAGRNLCFSIRVPGIARHGPGLFNLEVFDPEGRAEPLYGGNLFAGPGWQSWRLPLALNDPAGSWEIRVTDVASGRQTITHLKVAGPPHDVP